MSKKLKNLLKFLLFAIIVVIAFNVIAEVFSVRLDMTDLRKLESFKYNDITIDNGYMALGRNLLGTYEAVIIPEGQEDTSGNNLGNIKQIYIKFSPNWYSEKLEDKSVSIGKVPKNITDQFVSVREQYHDRIMSANIFGKDFSWLMSWKTMGVIEFDNSEREIVMEDFKIRLTK